MTEQERQQLLKELDREQTKAKVFIVVYIITIITVNIPLAIKFFNWLCK